MRNKVKFGIVNPYPGDRIPEEEIINRIQRLIKKDKEYNVEFYVFDRKGYLLNDSSKHIDDLDLDFVIDSDHGFCSLTADCFSYMCMWLPSGYPSRGLYPEFIFKINSIDDFFDNFKIPNEVEYLQNSCKGTGHLFNENMHFFATPGLNGSLLKPKLINNYKLIYLGINAERIGHEKGKVITKKGRFHDLFVELDKKNYMRFHGPEFLAGIKPWAGFEQYAGEIPFDGNALFKKINEYGVSLVLHYKAHEYRGLPTTKIFEAAASGAIIIADDFPFIRKTFGDTVFLIDTSKSAQEIAQEINNIMNWIHNNPEKALEKAKASQQVFLDKLVNKDVVKEVCKNHEKRKKEIYHKLHEPLKGKIVDIIVPCKTNKEKDVDHFVKQIINQEYPNINAIFVCSKEIAYYIQKAHSDELKKNNIVYKIVTTEMINWPIATKTTGEFILKAKPNLKGEFFLILDVNQIVQKVHISSLMNRMVQKENLLVTYSGTYQKILNERIIKNNRPIAISEIVSFYKYHDVPRSTEYSRTFDTFQTKFLKSSALFKAEILDYSPDNELKFMEGCEHIYFLIKAIIKNGLGAYSFTHRVSSGIEIPCNNSGGLGVIDNYLYPYRLHCIEDKRVFQMTSAQLLDCFVTDVNFEQYALNYTSAIVIPSPAAQSDQPIGSDDQQTIKYLTKLLLPSMRLYSTVKRKLRSLF